MAEFVGAKNHKQEIRERRNEVSSLLKFYNETEIVNILGKSRSTIGRDVAYLRKSARAWIDSLAKDGFIFEYKIILEKIKERGARLEKLYQETDDVWQKISITAAQDKNDKLYIELLAETPAIHAYRKAVKIAHVPAT